MGGARKFLCHLEVLVFLDTFTEKSSVATHIKLYFERCLTMRCIELLLDQLLTKKPNCPSETKCKTSCKLILQALLHHNYQSEMLKRSHWVVSRAYLVPLPPTHATLTGLLPTPHQRLLSSPPFTSSSHAHIHTHHFVTVALPPSLMISAD
jgi:hypothetical protein